MSLSCPSSWVSLSRCLPSTAPRHGHHHPGRDRTRLTSTRAEDSLLFWFVKKLMCVSLSAAENLCSGLLVTHRWVRHHHQGSRLDKTSSFERTGTQTATASLQHGHVHDDDEGAADAVIITFPPFQPYVPSILLSKHITSPSHHAACTARCGGGDTRPRRYGH